MTRLTGSWRAALALLMALAALPAQLSAGTGRPDRTPPPPPPPVEAPQSLTAEAHTSNVVLDWHPVRGAAAYRVFRSTTGVWDPNPVATVGHSRFWNGGLTNGTVYGYKVAAVNRGGLGPFSAIVRAVPLAPPEGLTAVPGDRQITLTWRASAGATKYTVYRSMVWEHHTFAPVATNVTALTFVDTGLTNGKKYIYRVRALADGGASRLSHHASAKPLASPVPPPTTAPTNVVSSLTNDTVTLKWDPVTGATSYRVFRSTTTTFDATPIATVTNPTFSQAGPAAGVTYSYRVAAHNDGGDGPFSAVVVVSPTPPPATAPANLVSSLNGSAVTLVWGAVPTATSYRVFRTTNNTFDATPIATVTTPTFMQTGLVVGVTYSYRVTARNAGGDGPASAVVVVTLPPPTPPPAAPGGVSAAPGNGQNTVSWAAVTGATAYNVYRGAAAGGQAATPVGARVATSPFVDAGLTNGVTYFYRVTAIGVGGESARSAEFSATPQAPPPTTDPTTISAFRLLRQSTWGPKPGDVDRLVAAGASGIDAFLAEQVAAPMSVYPDTLYEMSLESSQEHFMGLALTGPDQLRQRVAWALHKIWVVSGVEINNPRAILPYYRLMMGNAFGNYRDLMKAVTLNPAMGRYLNMVNNRAQATNNNIPANENYPRELMQLFTLGLTTLNPDGTPRIDPATNQPEPSYSEEDVKALARILTGWTYGDSDAATIPAGNQGENFLFPMAAIRPASNRHDVTQKTFLGEDFPAGVAAEAELDHALQVIFDHPNVAFFVSRQLIQQLVTSNPSQMYVNDIAAVFGSSDGNLGAVVRAILTHTDAGVTTPTSGKLAEPVLFVVSQLRALNATVTDHPFMSDKVAEMGQNVFFPPSVFSYFSPGYRVRNTGTPPLGGPEFQGLTTVTALVRANFVGRLISNGFGDAVAIDYTQFNNRAANPADLVDYVGLVFTGGRLSAQQRSEIIAAVGASTTNATERVRTALYLTLVPASSQVDR